MCHSAAGAHDVIVKLHCDGDVSCFGVALNWNLMLTTTTCAQSCSSIFHNGQNYQIERTMHHPQGKMFSNVRHFKAPRRLALIKIKDGTLTSFVGLLSMDIESLVGTRVISTIAAKSAFKEKIVKYCIFGLKRTGRAYVCTEGDRKENCSLQGLPLFKDKRVIALSEKQNLCNIQRAYISVGSFIPWVNSVLKYSKMKPTYNKAKYHRKPILKQNITHSRFIVSRHKEHQKSQTSKEYNTEHQPILNQSGKTRKTPIRRVKIPKARKSRAVLMSRAATAYGRETTYTINACSRNIETLPRWLKNKNIKMSRGRNAKFTIANLPTTTAIVYSFKFTIPKGNGNMNVTNLLGASSKGECSIKRTTVKKIKRIRSKEKTVPCLALNTERLFRTTITSNKFLIIKNISNSFAPSHFSTITGPISSSTDMSKLDSNDYPLGTTPSTINNDYDSITSSASNIANGNTALPSKTVSRFQIVTTNALDWFKKRLDDRLKQGSPPVLVLTTSIVTKEFVDLT
ncbi:unnamed protein product [Pieris macdunnoughi]|uniref:Uncharacterized protein n=1 Tax=Pieris macdunnoughi TaxID=345717 RepID=A0A821LNN0_9NEOP|nr:unnamed protein product [Pieris macdunnoughi]